MFAFAAKITLPPAIGMWALLATAIPSLGTLAALAGAGLIIGGAVMVGSLRQALANARTNVELARERADLIAEKLERLEKRNAYLEAQPNLEQHAKLLAGLTDLVAEQTEMLTQIRTAVVPPL